jgi:hypothetical protein
MTKNAKTLAIVIIVAVFVVVLVVVARDLWLRNQVVNCGDGPHPKIDVRDFETQYWAYTVKLEATVADKGKISAELDPKLLARVSEALQDANEFRKYVVVGYNSCAVTPAQFAQLGEKFRTLDGLAREINTMVSKPNLSSDENKELAGLLSQYRELLGHDGLH